MKKEVKRAAAYIRVSTHDQEEFSPDSQRKLIQEYAASHGLLLNKEHIYQDDGISGRKAEKRPAFMAMIAAAQEKPHPFDVILVWKFSRFARNQEESIVYKSLLKREGVEVVSISEPVVEGPYGELIERIIEWFDAFYSANLGAEVRRGMTERVSRGLPVTVAPFGYCYRDGQLVPDPEEAQIVRGLFKDFLDGTAAWALMKRLNAQGVRTHRGNMWTYRTVKYLLINPIYAGKIRWNPEGVSDYKTLRGQPEEIMLVDGQHQALITPEEYERAVAKVRVSEDRYGRHYEPPEGASWRLQGLVHCAACGSTLTRTTIYAVCSHFAHGKCDLSQRIRVTALEALVIQAIRYSLEDLSYEVVRRGPALLDSERQQITQELRREEQALDRLREAYIAGIDTLEEYRAHKQSYEQRRVFWQRKLDALPQKEEPIDKLALRDHFRGMLDRLEDESLSIQDRNEIARSFIDHIIWDRDAGSVQITLYIAE